MNWQIAIKGFELHIQLEKGLSNNSIKAYLSDIHKLEDYTNSILEKTSFTIIIQRVVQNECILHLRTQEE